MMALPFRPEHRSFVEEPFTTTNGSESEVHLCRAVVQVHGSYTYHRSRGNGVTQIMCNCPVSTVNEFCN